MNVTKVMDICVVALWTLGVISIIAYTLSQNPLFLPLALCAWAIPAGVGMGQAARELVKNA